MSEPLWLTYARKELGTLEGPGDTNNPKVLEYFREAGHGEVAQDSVAWCAAFVGAMLHRAGVKGTGALSARGYEHWGETVRQPILGCIGVKRRPGGEAWQGHVGFVVAASPTNIWLLGGNQADSVSIAAFSRWQFTSFRWPSVEIPGDLGPLPMTLAGALAGVKES